MPNQRRNNQHSTKSLPLRKVEQLTKISLQLFGSSHNHEDRRYKITSNNRRVIYLLIYQGYSRIQIAAAFKIGHSRIATIRNKYAELIKTDCVECEKFEKLKNS